MHTIRILIATGLITTGALMGCSTDDPSVQSAENAWIEETGGWLSSVRNVSDHGNRVSLAGRAKMYDGKTKLALFNHSRPDKQGILVDVPSPGAFMAEKSFEVDVDFGDYTVPDGLFAYPGDCVSIANVGFGSDESLTLEDARRVREFGAFMHANTDGAGRAHPSWATNGPEVYSSVEECLADPMRTAKDDGTEKLVQVTDPADFGHIVGLRGYILFGEGIAHLVLRNVSHPEQNGPDGSIGSTDIRRENPRSSWSVEGFETYVQWEAPDDNPGYFTPNNGDCIAAVSRYASDSGAEHVIGAFRWCHEGLAAWSNACPKGIELFDTPEACLAAPK